MVDTRVVNTESTEYGKWRVIEVASEHYEVEHRTGILFWQRWHRGVRYNDCCTYSTLVDAIEAIRDQSHSTALADSAF